MPLEFLAMGGLQAADLAPLAEMTRLHELRLEKMTITDLKPIRNVPLRKLSLKGSSVSDLSPLQSMPLKHLEMDYLSDHKELLRSLTELESINNQPVAEFWKEIPDK
jgi:Leucine-rich repeat (LRR) protein